MMALASRYLLVLFKYIFRFFKITYHTLDPNNPKSLYMPKINPKTL